LDVIESDGREGMVADRRAAGCALFTACILPAFPNANFGINPV
jgi:hypothetical protein